MRKIIIGALLVISLLVGIRVALLLNGPAQCRGKCDFTFALKLNS